MRKIVASEFMSLDAVTQATGGAEEDTEGGFDQGGWTLPYWHNEIGTPYMRVMGESDAVLWGASVADPCQLLGADAGRRPVRRRAERGAQVCHLLHAIPSR